MLHPGFYRPSEKPTASAERALATISILQQESTLRGCRSPFHCTTLQPCNQPAVDITTPIVGRGRVTWVSPGICANDGCDYTAEVEPDQDRAGARAAAPTPALIPGFDASRTWDRLPSASRSWSPGWSGAAIGER